MVRVRLHAIQWINTRNNLMSIFFSFPVAKCILFPKLYYQKEKNIKVEKLSPGCDILGRQNNKLL